MPLSVAIAGASGYVGGELMRLISKHKELDLKTVTAKSSVGQRVSSLHPGIRTYGEMVFEETVPENLASHDVVFLALPHGASADVAKQLAEIPLVIDCGADFRLTDSVAWQEFYKTTHAGSWSYGLPELTLAEGGKQRGRLRETKRIAVPGCNVTAVTLALAPALTAGLIEPEDIVATLTVGTSGAGRSASHELSASSVIGSARAYGVGGLHRHTPEIQQNLALAGGKKVSVSFTPVLAPMKRGILAVNTARVTSSFSEGALREVYQDAYGDEQFIELLPAGEFPTTASVMGSNVASLGLSFDRNSGRVIIVSAIDNLVKGTAGAAIQSMNISLGFSERTGLEIDAVNP